MARKLNTKKMQDLLKEGLILAKTHKHGPSDGTLIPLINRNKDGWHYQVEWLKDSRFYKKPRIIVYAWSKNSGFTSSYADYYLFKEVRDK